MPPRTFSFDFTLERSALPQVLRILLHTILFQRVLGTLVSRTHELYGLSFVGVTDPSLVTLIDSKVDTFVKDSAQSTGGVVLLRWFEKRLKKTSTGWFASSTPASDPDPFEEWRINLNIQKGSTERERAKIEDQTRSELASFQLKAIHFCQTERDHIPPITNAQLSPFPFDIILNPTSSSRRSSISSPRSGADTSSATHAATGWTQGLRRFMGEE